jgi:hypothetical protein
VITDIQHSYHYSHPSTLSEGGLPQLSLAASCAASDVAPVFFQGDLKSPRLTAELLSAVHLVVGSRFFTPANTLAKIIAASDPVVTAGGRILRFEGLSGCCSTYVRVDLLSDSFVGAVIGKGTTNVDFNPPMRAALARVRDGSGLALSVAKDALALESASERVVEKKVYLPVRWVRSLAEVQSYMASMRMKIEVPGHEALRFFRTLPKTSTRKTPLWIVSGPYGLHTTTRAEHKGVRMVDTTRLRVLESLLPKATTLVLYATDDQQASACVLAFPGARLTLTLSAEVWRGFSGEGQALRALLHSDDTLPLAQLRAQLHWQDRLITETLASELGIRGESAADALRILGVSGVVGFDLAEQAYFHRVLPYAPAFFEDMQPRLAGARALLTQGAVKILPAGPLEATVTSTDVEHRVREVEGSLHCTCAWYAQHQGLRGPCKHVLAVEYLAALHEKSGTNP